MSQITGPPHDFFCECCEWWRKNIEVMSAKMREREQVEETDDKDFHEAQADGFTE